MGRWQQCVPTPSKHTIPVKPEQWRVAVKNVNGDGPSLQLCGRGRPPLLRSIQGRAAAVRGAEKA